MSLRIFLSQGPNYVYTNLDTISGKVTLALPREETFNQITVKLECEARTRLAAPREGNRNQRYEQELEVHKARNITTSHLLYKTDVVFPSGQLQAMVANQRGQYTLPYGQHEWPFQFRIPFNNACAPVNSIMDRMQMAQDYNQHIKRPLPPTLSGYPGMCEIRYYVKCTAQRSSLFKENFRAEQSIMFLPIEPVRSPPNKRESFARRQHQFSPSNAPPPSGGMFKGQRPKSASGPPPAISIDGRLPDPAIVTCNEPLPLRVLVRKLNETNQMIFLGTFQIMLIAHTKIRAHALSRVEQNSWVIVSKANMRVPLGGPDTPAKKDIEVDRSLWASLPLPNAVCPTFETCNVERKYELKVSIGLMYGTPSDIKPELSIQEVFMPCKVYSGIEPPAALVEEMFKKQHGKASDMPYNAQPSNQGAAGPGFQPRPRPPPGQTSPGPSDPDEAVPAYSPAAPGAAVAGAPPPGGAGQPEAPPPSYEDAMADDIGPVDGPRRNYEQPASAPVVGDEKRGSLFGGGRD